MKKPSFIAPLIMILIAKIVPFNCIIGSHHAIFSWTTMLAPALTKHYGFAWISLFFVSSSLIFAETGIYSILLLLLHRTPLIFSARAYHLRHWSTSFLLPGLCIALFVMHDIGSVAWCYSLYWLIPMVLYFVPNSLLARAISASFVAHAVGSVIWLYTKSIPCEIWIGLIPVVICERLLMAGGMLAFDLAIVHAIKLQPWTRVCKILGWA